MTFKSNLKRLNKLLELAPRKNREKIKEVIQLYEDKKIPNIKTAHLAVLQLANPSIFKKADETKLSSSKKIPFLLLARISEIPEINDLANP